MNKNANCLNSALAYAEIGVRVVCLHPNTKFPIGKNWGKRTTLDEDRLLTRFDPSEGKDRDRRNIGVLLGPYPEHDPLPGIVDIEFDDEQGRQTAQETFGDEGEVITPTYRSRRSTHRLFRWNADFPLVQKLDIDGLEVRLGGGEKQTQSVLPPSLFCDPSTGKTHRYEWVPGLSFDDCEIAEVPADVGERIKRARKPSWREVLDGKAESTFKPHEPATERDIQYARNLLRKMTAAHADDYESWFRAGLAAKTIAGDQLLDDWLAFSAKSSKRKRQRSNATAKWHKDFSPNGQASVHTLERIVFGHALPEDACIIGMLEIDNDNETSEY